jgi:hypothetical protein
MWEILLDFSIGFCILMANLSMSLVHALIVGVCYALLIIVLFVLMGALVYVFLKSLMFAVRVSKILWEMIWVVLVFVTDLLNVLKR